MKPGELTASSFAGYPAAARALAADYLPLLRTIPLSLLPSYLVQVQAYDTLFPLEAERLRVQLAALAKDPARMQAFAAIAMPPQLEQLDWVARPTAFVGALAGALWQTHQTDAYHRAGEALFAALPQVSRPAAAPMLLAVLGQGATPGRYPLFTRLRSAGMHVQQVKGDAAVERLCRKAAERAAAAAEPYTHWYIDGGKPWQLGVAGQLEQVSFPALAPVTDAVLREMDRAVRQGSGPEVLADRLSAMQPDALGLGQVTTDPRLARFLVQVLTQGSGTQLYSTSFVQAAAVELVRRAQPQTLLLRFAPRRRPASMNDMLEQRAQGVELDADGALVDADMGLYYAWLAMRKGPGGERATLLAYVEGQGEAFVAGPTVTRGVESASPLTMEQLFGMLG